MTIENQLVQLIQDHAWSCTIWKNRRINYEVMLDVDMKSHTSTNQEASPVTE